MVLMYYSQVHHFLHLVQPLKGTVTSGITGCELGLQQMDLWGTFKIKTWHSAPLVLPKLTLDYLEPSLERVGCVQHW